MIKVKQFLCVALALLMLLPLLVACTKNKEPAGTPVDSQGTSESDVTEDITTEEELRYDEDGYLMDDLDLKGIDLGGKEFTILTGTTERYYITSDNALSGGALNAAVYGRQMAVEARLKCKLKYVQEPDGWDYRSSFIQKAQSMLMEDGVDMFAVYSLTTSAMMVQGLLQDLHQSTTLDFNKPWWNSEMVDGCTIHNKMYFCSGDIDYALIGYSFAFLYNKNIADSIKLDQWINTNYGEENIYDLVNEGKWTYDKMMAIAKLVAVDEDGIKNKEDTFGYVGDAINTDSFYQGCGLKQIVTGPDGSVMISPDHNSAKAGKIMDDLLEFLNSPAAYSIGNYNGIDVPIITLMNQGQALFFHAAVMDAASAVKTYDRGVLPCPKYDEEQEKYLTVPGFPYHMWAIARGTSRDYEEICAIMEAMASEGYRKVIPIYFYTIVAGRQETVDDMKMLEIIRAGIVIDGGRVMDSAFNTDTWSIWRRCVLLNRDYLAYYEGYENTLLEQATSLNILIRNMEKLYG